MPQDKYSSTDSVTSPARNCFAITPSDAGELSSVTKAIYVGTGGDVTLLPADNLDDVIFRNVPSGMTLDVRASAVRSSGTTAADLVGFL